MRTMTLAFSSLLIFFSTCVLHGCAYHNDSNDILDSIPLYDGATDVDKRVLIPKKQSQIYFRVRKEFPNNDVLGFYKGYFSKSGWLKCEGRMEDWQSYVDSAGRDAVLIHQVANYWFNEEKGILSIVSLRYRSGVTDIAATPDSNNQDVFVLLENNIDIAKESSRLKLNCDK